jgi:hypothetical protein
VIEHGAGVENHLEQKYGEGWCAERHDDRDLPQHRKRDLDGVKPYRGGYVDVAVGVVHLMQAPEDGDLVGGEMLRPDGEIEGEQRSGNLDPQRPRNLVQEPELVLLGIERGGDCRNRYGEHRHQPEHGGCRHADAEIG